MSSVEGSDEDGYLSRNVTIKANNRIVKGLSEFGSMEEKKREDGTKLEQAYCQRDCVSSFSLRCRGAYGCSVRGTEVAPCSSASGKSLMQ